jgi:hypothetical protein
LLLGIDGGLYYCRKQSTEKVEYKNAVIFGGSSNR